MRLWARTRSVVGLAAAMVTMLVAGTLLGHRSIVLPTLIGYSGQLLITNLLPIVWAAAVARSFAGVGQGPDTRPAATPAFDLPRIGVLDAALFLGAAGVSAAGYAFLVVVTDTWLSGIGSVLLVSAVALVVTARAGPAWAVFVTFTLLLGTSMYGVGAPYWRYVRILETDASASFSLGVGAALCLVSAWLLVSRRFAPRHPATE